MRLAFSLAVAFVLALWFAATAAEPARAPFGSDATSSRNGVARVWNAEQVASSPVEIARAEIDLEATPPTILLEGSSFCDYPEVTMGSPGGAFNGLAVISTTETSILAELVDTAPATYVVQVNCEDGREGGAKVFHDDDSSSASSWDDDSSDSSHSSDDISDPWNPYQEDGSDESSGSSASSGSSGSSGSCADDDCSGGCCPERIEKDIIDVTIAPRLDGGQCPAGHCVIAVDPSGMIVCGDCSGGPFGPQACPENQCVLAVDANDAIVCGDCEGEPFGPQACPENQCVLAVDANDAIVCGDCEGEPFGPQACPENQCVLAVDANDAIICGDCGTPLGPQLCPRGECVVGLDPDDVIICGECRGSDQSSCAFVEEARIGSWCIDRFQRTPANFIDATTMCHEDRKVICPVEALAVCDVVEPAEVVPADGGVEFQVDPGFSQCSSLTDDSALRFWTSTLEPSFDAEVFQAIVIYGGDNRMRMGEANELHPYFCCKPADRFVPHERPKRESRIKSGFLREVTGASPLP